jgi:hypothetical protein
LTQQTAVIVAASQQEGLHAPFLYVFIAATVIVVARFWLGRRAPFRAAAQRGGWRLAAALLSSLGILVFGVGVAVGQLVIAFVALIAAAPFIWLLIMYSGNRPQQ